MPLACCRKLSYDSNGTSLLTHTKQLGDADFLLPVGYEYLRGLSILIFAALNGVATPIIGGRKMWIMRTVSAFVLCVVLAACVGSGSGGFTKVNGVDVNWGPTELKYRDQGVQALFQFKRGGTRSFEQRVALAKSAVANSRRCKWVDVPLPQLRALTIRQTSRNFDIFLIAVVSC